VCLRRAERNGRPKDRPPSVLSRSDAAARAALISRTYRDGGGSGAVRTEAGALARRMIQYAAPIPLVEGLLQQ
jgi:hypothetical protein